MPNNEETKLLSQIKETEKHLREIQRKIRELQKLAQDTSSKITKSVDTKALKKIRDQLGIS
jgi:chaperonin cofactor prefoldin